MKQQVKLKAPVSGLGKVGDIVTTDRWTATGLLSSGRAERVEESKPKAKPDPKPEAKPDAKGKAKAKPRGPSETKPDAPSETKGDDDKAGA